MAHMMHFIWSIWYAECFLPENTNWSASTFSANSLNRCDIFIAIKPHTNRNIPANLNIKYRKHHFCYNLFTLQGPLKWFYKFWGTPNSLYGVHHVGFDHDNWWPKDTLLCGHPFRNSTVKMLGKMHAICSIPIMNEILIVKVKLTKNTKLKTKTKYLSAVAPLRIHQYEISNAKISK